MQGTCEALITQVAESLNIQIYIIESYVNIGPVTLIDPDHTSSQQTRPVYKLDVGHANETPYISTVPKSSYSGNEQPSHFSFTETKYSF